MIQSRFTFGRVYFLAFFSLGMLLFGLYLITLPPLTHRGAPPLLGGILCLVPASFLGYILLRTAIAIRIEDDWLYLRGFFFRKVLHAENIATIDLQGRVRLYKNKLRYSNVITLLLTDGETIHLPDDNYRNIRQLKEAFLKNFGSLIVSLPERQSDFLLAYKPDLAEEATMDVFKGHVLFNSVWAVTIFVLFMTFVPGLALGWGMSHSHGRHPDWRPYEKLETALILGAVVLALVIVSAGKLYYFKVSDRYLVVRHQVYPWIRKIYLLEGISSVVFELSRGGNYALRIRKSDFGSESYTGGSLSRNTWEKLKQRLQKEGFVVIDEQKPAKKNPPPPETPQTTTSVTH